MHAQSIAQEATGQQTLEHAHALNSDIIKTIHKNYVRGVQQMQKHAPKFKGRNTTETAQNIWNFLKKEINYKRDPDHAQLIKLPGRLAADQTGDCKSYSLFAASVLGALGKPVAFRYTSYTSDNTPSHVYTVTKNEAGQDVIIDAVYNQFNAEKPYKHKIDKKMKVYTLAGIHGAQTINGVNWEQVKEKIKTGGLTVAHFFYFTLLLPVRTAFLLLVKNNVFGLASKLWAAQYINKKAPQIDNLWYGMGGRRGQLNVSILTGSKKKPIWSKQEKINGLGLAGEPISITVLLASAGTAMAAFNEFTKEGKEALNNAKQTAKDLGIPVDDILNEGNASSGGGATSSGSGTTTGSNTVNVRLVSTGPGTIKLDRSPYNIPVGTRVTVTATPAPGYKPKWLNGSNATQVGATVTKEGQIISVQFVPINSSGGGSGSGPTEGGTTAAKTASAAILPIALAAGAYFLFKK